MRTDDFSKDLSALGLSMDPVTANDPSVVAKQPFDSLLITYSHDIWPMSWILWDENVSGERTQSARDFQQPDPLEFFQHPLLFSWLEGRLSGISRWQNTTLALYCGNTTSQACVANRFYWKPYFWHLADFAD